ncbi:putative transporter [Trachipleistophora hominis]|uniref:Putative transporter n=1 Tax=Trachipleistophora hominis TaxID=72359 RepID=L7JWI3_TRAHO|nr:putative transporter [Trachipleistophora hominis]
MYKTRCTGILLCILHITHVLAHRTSFIFFNTSFFIYNYRRLHGDISYLSILSFMVPSLVYHVVELCFIRWCRTNRPLEVLEYVAFLCVFMMCVSRFVDCIFKRSPCIFIVLVCIQNVLTARIGLFYDYSLYEQCFNESVFYNRIVLMVFEEVPVYLSALFMTYTVRVNSFQPYYHLCILLYIVAGAMQCVILLRKEKVLESVHEHVAAKRNVPLFVLCVLCKTNEIFLFLVLTARTENISTVVFYFSIDFLFRLLPFKMPKNALVYLLKVLIVAITFYCIIDQQFFHVYLSLFLFLANGFSNQMVYNAVSNSLMGQSVSDSIVFMLFSVFLPFFAKKYSLRDFIFFNAVRL